MKKRVTKVVKMELPGGNAHPGPKLASAGVNMAKFCTDFNAKTGDRKGDIVPVIITAYEDKSYDFVIKTTPAAPLILKAAGLKKGSGNVYSSSLPAGQLSDSPSPKLNSKRSPSTRCRTSTPRTSRWPRKSSPAPAAKWASRSSNEGGLVS